MHRSPLSLAFLGIVSALGFAQPPAPTPASPPASASAAESAKPQPAAALYRALSNVGLDSARIYKIRTASMDRGAIHISLDDGMIGFLQPVNGRVTGAFFEGEGEILVLPPNQAERGSLALFTGAAVLEEQFVTGFLRFNDDTSADLEPYLRPVPEEEARAFFEKWDSSLRTIAYADAQRLLLSFVNVPPATGPTDRFLRAHLGGAKLGYFDALFDSLLAEPVSVGQLSTQEGLSYYNIWTSFKPVPAKSPKPRTGQPKSSKATPAKPSEPDSSSEAEREGVAGLRIDSYKISVNVHPPRDLEAETTIQLRALEAGHRIVLLELSRYLKVREVTLNGRRLEFLQNEALEGTTLARKGDDLVVVIFPEPLTPGQPADIHFSYGGSVMSEAGGGLVYVGARGAWYPNLGFGMADFDLQFHFPDDWTLVATGKRVSLEHTGGEQAGHWVSEKPMPIAGFNLGKYVKATASIGGTLVESYAARGVERNFPGTTTQTVEIRKDPQGAAGQIEVLASPSSPTPAVHAQAVADEAALDIDFLSRLLGPYPYSSLTLSQMPGNASQGWPGLVFLSSYVFLSSDELHAARLSPADILLFSKLMEPHEVGHQWWGDMVIWKSYRDQWLVEALSNYCALTMMEENRPQDFQAVLENYRQELLRKRNDDIIVADAGAVTLGTRLSSSRFPRGFEVVSYGRGTWLLHMLREMMRDGEVLEGRKKRSKASSDVADEPFFRALRALLERNRGKEISTSDLERVLEEFLPSSLRYEGRKSLDWFFEHWVGGTALPRYSLSAVKFTSRPGGSVVTGKLLQKDAPAAMVTSVPIYGVAAGKPVLLGRVFADAPETSFRLEAPAGVHKLQVDPYQTILTRP